jgi:hypothetical protein
VCPVGIIDNLYNLSFALDGCNVATFLSVVDDPGHDVNAALERLAVGYLTYSS